MLRILIFLEHQPLGCTDTEKTIILACGAEYRNLQIERLSAYGPQIDNAVISTTCLGMKNGRTHKSSPIAVCNYLKLLAECPAYQQ